MLSVGSLLHDGKYRIDEILSQQGCSVTYRATYALLSQPMLLKTLDFSTIQNREAETLKTQFLAEGRRLIALRHPHLVSVRDCFIEDDQPFMAMECVAGESLAQKIARGPLLELDAIRYIRQIAQGLTCLHQYNLLHREVKPSNIIVNPDQNAILINLGTFSKVRLDQAPLNSGDASSGFEPPEQYLDPPSETTSTDVYGLASTLYALTTGHSPTASVLRAQIPLRNPRDFNSSLSSQIEQTILTGMALAIEERPNLETWLALCPEIESSAQPIGQPKQEPPENGASVPLPAVPETLESQFSKELPMPTSKNQSIPSRSSNQRVRSSGLLVSPFPKRALLLSASVAALGGAGFGFYLRTKLFVPLFAPTQLPIASPKEHIEESFPPKNRPKLYDTTDSDPSPNGTSVPTDNPDVLEPRQTPPTSKTLNSNAMEPSPSGPSLPSTSLPVEPSSLAPSSPKMPQAKPKPTFSPDDDLSPSPEVANPSPSSEEDSINSPSSEFPQQSPSGSPSDGPLSSP